MLVVHKQNVASYIGDWLMWPDEVTAERRIAETDWYWLGEWEFYVCFGGWWNGTLIDSLN